MYIYTKLLNNDSVHLHVQNFTLTNADAAAGCYGYIR